MRRIADPRRTMSFTPHMTILAYCVVTSSMIDATFCTPHMGIRTHRPIGSFVSPALSQRLIARDECGRHHTL